MNPGRTRALLGLRAVLAGLLVASGLIHLRLWFLAYRNVTTLDVLFLVQVALALVLAVALLLTARLGTARLMVIAASGALMAGTLIGFLLARTVGIFGFQLRFSSALANWALAVELSALVLLAATAVLVARPART